MKLDKNGWGTIEMILLSCGLLVALIVSIYFISQLFGDFNMASSNKVYSDLEVKLIDSTKRYVENEISNINLPFKVSLDDLKRYGYISDFKDDNGNDCNGYVIINESVTYNYNAYISCQNYISENY